MSRPPQISASILNADFASLGAEVERAARGGVDSIHLDVMDGHFVPNISLGPVVVEAVRPVTQLPFHSHLMISEPLRYVDEFAEAGSDLVIFHVEADDDPDAVIDAIRAAGKQPGIAINPETPAESVHPYLERVEMLLVMTVHPGFGGQAFIHDVMPKLRSLGAEIERRGLELPIGEAYAAGGEVLVVGSALYRNRGDLAPVIAELRATAAAAGERRPAQ
jgi:ribulose-phosphate 3-epimerase